MTDRQAAELQALAPSLPGGESATLDLNKDAEPQVDMADETVGGEQPRPVAEPMVQSPPESNRAKKPNRHKARLARRAAEQEAQVAAAEAEAANMPDQRQQELSSMKEQLARHRLAETLIRPDGHCLYSACAHSLPSDLPLDYKSVRRAAATFIATHPDDFAPFMEEPVQSYIHKIKDTAEWGGHLELQAIASAYHVAINVLHANGNIDKITPEQTPTEEIWLSYYRHSFGLGEHYNALRRAAVG